jgi:DNA repair protein RadC
MTMDGHSRIAERPLEMRPRERLLYDSPLSLSNAELIAILLQTGTSGRDVLELADDVLLRFEGLAGLGKATPEELLAIKGVGQSKACMILAAVEISRRLSKEGRGYSRPHITGTLAAAQSLRDHMTRNDQETFHALYLDAKHTLICDKELFVGTLNYSLVHVRDIFRHAVRCNAAAVIVGHNHPSGDVTPSREDKEVTKKIVEAGKLLDIPVLDHIIVGNLNSDRFLSMHEEGYV